MRSNWQSSQLNSLHKLVQYHCYHSAQANQSMIIRVVVSLITYTNLSIWLVHGDQAARWSTLRCSILWCTGTLYGGRWSVATIPRRILVTHDFVVQIRSIIDKSMSYLIRYCRFYLRDVPGDDLKYSRVKIWIGLLDFKTWAAPSGSWQPKGQTSCFGAASCTNLQPNQGFTQLKWHRQARMLTPEGIPSSCKVPN